MNEVAPRFDHAHNDWLQSWVEGGILAFACVVALPGLLFFKDDRRRPVTGPSVRVTAATAAGLAALAVHSLMDFSLRIPAVAVLAACLAGVLAGQHAPLWRSAHRWNVSRMATRGRR